jgi:hypothetical protein
MESAVACEDVERAALSTGKDGSFVVLGHDQDELLRLGGAKITIHGVSFSKEHDKKDILALLNGGNVGDNEAKKEITVLSPSLYLSTYSDKSVALFGSTKAIKEKLKELGGRFNAHLNDPQALGSKCPGWVYPIASRDSLIAQLKVFISTGAFPAPAAGAPCTSAADKAARTARARAQVQTRGRSPLSDVLTSARLHTSCAPHRSCTVDAPDRLGVLRKRQRNCPRAMDRLQRRRTQ